jgi:hypothetical protein
MTVDARICAIDSGEPMNLNVHSGGTTLVNNGDSEGEKVLRNGRSTSHHHSTDRHNTAL